MSKQKALDILQQIELLTDNEKLKNALSKVITSKSSMTWLDVCKTLLPAAVDSVENSKVVLTSKAKNKLVSDLILPLIKDKLPWYIKPFAGKLLSSIIDLVIAVLNGLFTKDWGNVKKELTKDDEKLVAGTN